ncbi:olfactory receptor 14A16-like [Cinclus cinclus]|uniref:olfactory receptor 14A16-like n=1 Tax=Cinclus cinclus TaxID=127875 RepID=UPI002E106719
MVYWFHCVPSEERSWIDNVSDHNLHIILFHQYGLVQWRFVSASELELVQNSVLTNPTDQSTSVPPLLRVICVHIDWAVIFPQPIRMFFFLLNLALTDLGSICTTVPKAMHNSLWHTNNISYSACAAQVFLVFFFLGTEFSLLTIMSYDRYVSICKPLHYGTLLGSRACAHMAAAAWASAFLNALLHTANTFSLPLCHGNALGQFFCEIPQILKLSCSKSYLRELGLLAVSAFPFFGCFVFIVFSYVQIFRAVLRIPSEQGRHKAFSTCLPHLAVVSLFISTGVFAYLKPPSISSPSLDLALSVLYSVVPPALNPLIYSLRNQELKLMRKVSTSVMDKYYKKN